MTKQNYICEIHCSSVWMQSPHLANIILWESSVTFLFKLSNPNNPSRVDVSIAHPDSFDWRTLLTKHRHISLFPNKIYVCMPSTFIKIFSITFPLRCSAAYISSEFHSQTGRADPIFCRILSHIDLLNGQEKKNMIPTFIVWVAQITDWANISSPLPDVIKSGQFVIYSKPTDETIFRDARREPYQLAPENSSDSLPYCIPDTSNLEDSIAAG